MAFDAKELVMTNAAQALENADEANGEIARALRLGWAIAEARGRYRMWDDGRLAPAGGSSRIEYTLPLADERSSAEQRIEVEDVLKALAIEAGVDVPDFHDLSQQESSPDNPRPATSRLTDLATALKRAHDSTEKEISAAWSAMAEFLYGWDAHIQDRLAAGPFGTASAYQLGRCLGEVYWALDSFAPPGAGGSWEFLLGNHRREEIRRLLARLKSHFDPLTISAVEASVLAWSTLALDPEWRGQLGVTSALASQARVWRDLLLTGVDPRTFVDPAGLIKRARQLRGVLTAFWPELLLLLAGWGGLTAAARIATGNGSHPASLVLAVLSAVGVTGAGLGAWAKNAAHDVLGKLRSAFYADLVNSAVTLCPSRFSSPTYASDGSLPGLPSVDHVIVLMLENRSFDHMLGYLKHPSREFDGLQPNSVSNPGWKDAARVPATSDAKVVLPVDPDHSHDAVMQQLAVDHTDGARKPTNQGFVQSYERKARGLSPPKLGGIVGSLVNVVSFVSKRITKGSPAVTDVGPLIMRCHDPNQHPSHVEALATLALEFGVCTRWFSSVPGETWPNRNFVHAATSDGETDIAIRFYSNPTIFEVLEQHGRTWRIYHDDTPQVWAFNELWDGSERRANWFPYSKFIDHAKRGELANYSFIEPNHRPPVHTLDHVGPDLSNSQHPGNNLVASREEYEQFVPPSDQTTDFERGDALIASVYEALRSNPAVFQRSILLITYDEHGGFFDHVPPPTKVPSPGGGRSFGTRLWRAIYRRRSEAFDFTMLGVRVPAVVVSPYIAKGAVDATCRDHASVPATLRALFAREAEPLTHRDAWSPPFHTLLTLRNPRSDLPDLGSVASGVALERECDGNNHEFASAAVLSPQHHYDDFDRLGQQVYARLDQRGEIPAALADDAETSRSHLASDAFIASAKHHRQRTRSRSTYWMATGSDADAEEAPSAPEE